MLLKIQREGLLEQNTCLNTPLNSTYILVGGADFYC